MTLSFAAVLAVALTSADPSRLYQGTEIPAFKAREAAAETAWQVRDWRGKAVREGRLGVDGKIRVADLPPGYWKLAVGDAELDFTTVIDPASRRRVEESSFAADSAFSWMDISYCYAQSFKTNFSHHLARLIRAAGISQTRERFCWQDVQKEKNGPFDWGRYLRNERMLHEMGIGVSWYNANAPEFVGGKGGGWGRQSFAKDLVALRDFCEAVGRDFGDTLADFEYLNEPDLGHPAWDATAQFKAAAVGFRAAKTKVPTTNFSMCLGVDFNYDNLVFDNDMAAYIDVFNIHHYGKLSTYDAFDARIHAFLEKRGLGDMPILVTESGCDTEGEARLKTDVERCRAHTPEQEMVYADFIPKAQIKRQFGGVWRNHFFVFASFHERGGRKDWGVIRRDGSARPGIAAFAALTAELDGYRNVGRIETEKGVEAYLYDHGDGVKTIAFWGTGRLAVKSDGPVRLTDWCGTPIEMQSKNGLVFVAADRHVAYLTGRIDAKIATPATPMGKLRLRGWPEGMDPEIVIRADFPASDFDVTDGYTAVEPKKDGRGRVKVEVWNLGDQPKKGRLVSENGILAGWPDGEIELPARGVFAREVTLRPQVGRDGEAKWRLQGVFEGRKTTAFTVLVRDFASGMKMLRHVTAAANEPPNWKKNTSALKVTFKPEEEAMRIGHSWGTDDPKVNVSDRWSYNQLKVPEAARNNLRYVAFEIRSEQDKVENNFLCGNVYVYGGKRCDRILCAKPTKEWTRIHVSVPARADAPVEWVGLGGNPAGKELTLWIRNVEFYCQ